MQIRIIERASLALRDEQCEQLESERTQEPNGYPSITKMSPRHTLQLETILMSSVSDPTVILLLVFVELNKYPTC